MVKHRKAERFPCSRAVQVQFFRVDRLCGTQDATVIDISTGGLQLRFDKPPPSCSRIMVQTSGHILPYRIRHQFQRDGSYFAGVQLETQA